jgi:hypothetical protein
MSTVQTLAHAPRSHISISQYACLGVILQHCRLLKEGAGAKALVHFEKALMLAKFLGNRVQERRAVRGLAAASRIQVRHRCLLFHILRSTKVVNPCTALLRYL